VGQLASALSMTVIDNDVARTWCLQRINGGALDGCTALLGTGVGRWSLRAKARGR